MTKPLTVLMVSSWWPAGPIPFLAQAFERMGLDVFRAGPTYNDHGGVDWGEYKVRTNLEFPREAKTWNIDNIISLATHFSHTPDFVVLSEENYQTEITPTEKIPTAFWSMDGWPNNYIRGEALNPAVKFTNHPRGIRIHPLKEDRPGWIYLPAAYAPWAHPFTNQKRDIDFVLHATQYGKRKEMCDYLRSAGLTVADGWVNTAQYAQDYNRGLFTYHNTGGQEECKFRLFEASGMGCVNFSDNTQLLTRNDFWPYEHYIPIESHQDETGDFWPNFQQLAQMIHDLKEHEDFRQTIARISRDARKNVCFAHTYYNRAFTILTELGFKKEAELAHETMAREKFWTEDE